MVYAAITDLFTPRLRLRKLRPDDAEDFFAFGGDLEVCKYMLWKPHETVADSEASIRTSLLRYDAEPYYRWGIALRESDRLIGIIQLLAFDAAENSCSFAYMLNKNQWGKGYGTEALKAAITFAFSRMQIKKVSADHFSENIASGAAMKKAGMIYVKTIPGKYEKDGNRYDADLYEISHSW